MDYANEDRMQGMPSGSIFQLPIGSSEEDLLRCTVSGHIGLGDKSQFDFPVCHPLSDSLRPATTAFQTKSPRSTKLRRPETNPERLGSLPAVHPSPSISQHVPSMLPHAPSRGGPRRNTQIRRQRTHSKSTQGQALAKAGVDTPAKAFARAVVELEELKNKVMVQLREALVRSRSRQI
jgi:hypothetical protein